MRPIKGFVSAKFGQTLTIKLESGRIITKQSPGNIDWGDDVCVGYDYTTDEYTTVERFDPETARSIDLMKAKEELGEEVLKDTEEFEATDNDTIAAEVFTPDTGFYDDDEDLSCPY